METENKPEVANSDTEKVSLFQFLKHLCQEYWDEVLFVVIGTLVLFNFLLDLALMIFFVVHGDYSWFAASFSVTFLSIIAIARNGLINEKKVEARWMNSSGNAVVSVFLSITHLRVLAYALRILHTVRCQEVPSPRLYKSFRDPLSIRGLSASLFMLALQTYVLENHSNGLIWVNIFFSGFFLVVGVVAHFCINDSVETIVWTVIHVIAQIFLRICTVSLLCTAVKEWSLLVTIPMCVIAIVFSGYTYEQSGMRSGKAYMTGLFLAPLVLLVAVRPKFSEIDPPFLGDLVTQFLAWRLAETAAVTVWLMFLPLADIHALVSDMSLGIMVAISVVIIFFTRFMMADSTERAHKDQNLDLQP